jgi:hypothetical protein
VTTTPPAIPDERLGLVPLDTAIPELYDEGFANTLTNTTQYLRP